MARLILTRGEHTQEYELLDATVLGRSSKNTIRVPEGKASRKHARIIRQGEDFVCEDLGSSNGTFVNDKRLSGPVVLKNGDIVRIGKTKFTFVLVNDDPLIGTDLGNYRIEERIGKGGMGAVYRATQLSMDRDVALKVMRRDFAKNPDFIKDFMREARLAGRLQHLNMIGIHDFGEAKGHYFISMEYVRGETLADRIRRTGHMKPAELIRVAAQIASALGHAHENDIIHQDVKPENVMLTENEQVKVADLGLAKAMSYSAIQDDKPVMGTPQYVAPEVVRRMPPDPRSDIYSLGATMFHAGVGTAPYEGDRATVIVRQHLEAPVPDPRQRRAGFPAPLAELIMKCMAKDPARRPATCKDLIRDLKSILKGSGAPARAGGSKQKPAVPLASQDGVPAPEKKRAKPTKAKDATDALPAVNPWRPVAVAIMLALSIFVAAVLAGGVYLLVKGSGSSEAARLLTSAKERVAEKDYKRAEEVLSQLLALHEESPEAAEARMLQDELRQLAREADGGRIALDTIRAEYDRQGLSGTEARQRLRTLLNRNDISTEVAEAAESLLQSIRDRSEADSGEDDDAPPPDNARQEAEAKALAAWTEVRPVIERKVAQEQTTEARELLATFVADYKGTEAGGQAGDMLKSLVERIQNAGRDLLVQAARDREAGRLAAAVSGLKRVLLQYPGSESAKQALGEIAAIDKDAGSRYFKVWDALLPRLKTLDVLPLRPAVRRLPLEVAGLSWEESANELGMAAEGVAALLRGLGDSVQNRGSVEVGVAGIGLAKVSVAGGNRISAMAKGGAEPVIVDWGKVWLSDITTLAPPSRISNKQRIGAALHCMSRGHLGYMRSYLQEVDATPEWQRRVREVLAQAGGRVMVEWFNFSDAAENERWQPVEGEWSFVNNRLATTDRNKARVGLLDRTFGLNSCAVSFNARTDTPTGQAAVLLVKDTTHFIAVRRTGKQVTIEYTNATAVPAAAESGALDPSLPIRLEVREGKARLVVRFRVLAELDVPETPSWQGQLYLEMSGTSGSFGDVAVETRP